MAIGRIAGLVILWAGSIAVAILATRSLMGAPGVQTEEATQLVVEKTQESDAAERIRAMERDNAVLHEELALNVLSLMHTKAALGAIMQLREPDLMELDYPYDLILPQAAVLPTEDIAEFIPEINRQIAQDLAAGDGGLAPEKIDLLAHLAFTHNSDESLRLLETPEAMGEKLTEALLIVEQSHSPQAREYVETVAREGGKCSPQARGIFDRW